MDPLAKLRAITAGGGALPGGSIFGEGPRQSPDLTRILALPRRRLEPTEALADKWTARLRRPGGTMRLRPIQAALLEEGFQHGGLMGLVGAGAGKTIPSLLLFTVWGSQNGALLVPPNLRTKLWDLEYPELVKHWRIPNLVGHSIQHPDTKEQFHVIAYSKLSSAKGADILSALGIDDLVCDEAHYLRHGRAARTKRFRRFARSGRSEPSPRVTFDDVSGGSSGLFRRRIACLSGSITSRSVNDYDHLCDLVRGDGSPLPRDWFVQREWGLALDATDTPTPPGALSALGDPVRDGFRRRLVETPGVVATTTNDPGMTLVFNRVPLKAPKAVLDTLKAVRETWLRPDGFPLRETIEVYALQRQLACGFYYRRIYPRGESKDLIQEWITAKKEYDGEVRDQLKRNVPGLDQPLLCWNAARDGRWKSETWARWAAVKSLVKPSKETVWLDTFLIDAAVDWAREKPGIVWVEAEALRAAFSIAEGAGIPVYAGGKKAAAAIIREDGSRSIVASMKAFNAGINLQHAFNRALITTSPADNALLEQVVARTHRPGQKADEVSVDFYLHTPELADALATARAKAQYVEETTENSQKLRIATWTF